LADASLDPDDPTVADRRKSQGRDAPRRPELPARAAGKDLERKRGRRINAARAPSPVNQNIGRAVTIEISGWHWKGAEGVAARLFGPEGPVLPGIKTRFPEQVPPAARTGETRAARGLVERTRRRLELIAQDVADAVSIEIAGALELAESPPRLGHLATKRPQLPFDRAPDIAQPVAIEVRR